METVNPIIRLREITFSYNGRLPVLDECNFSLYQGDRVGFMGPNGSGKTTLLHIIMGLLKPQRGEIGILGRTRKKEADFREVRESIGLLFQDSDDQLFCPTVVEDVAFGPLNLGKRSDEARAIVGETLQLLGLSGFEDRVTYKLSGGEKRLVSLATVLAMKPDVLLLDEPTSGLDDETKKKVIDVINRYADTFIIVSHDRELLELTTQSLYEMREGKINKSD